MPYQSTSELFPLPIAHVDRQRPEDFIPDLPDESGDAEKIWRVIRRLKLGLGKFSGQAFESHAQAWQKRLIWAIYGPTRFDGSRLVSEVFLSVAKKNGKTQFVALLTLAHALVFPRPDARFVLLAATRDQANLLYDPMRSSIEQDADLLKLCNVRGYKGDIVVYKTQSNIRCISPELHSTVGEVPSMFCVDELHLLGKKRTGAAMVRQLSSGLAVTGGIGIYITTAPIAGEPAAGIYLALYNRAKRILTGESEGETMLPVLFELPEDANPNDRRYWGMPNPSIGVTVTRAWLEQQYEIAKADPDPSVLSEYFSQHLNRRSDDVVAGIDAWNIVRCWGRHAEPTITLDSLVASGGKLFAGIDAGGQDDLTGLVVMAVDGDNYQIWSHGWLTRDGYEANPGNRPLYDDFIERGELTVVDVAGDDLDEVERILERLPGLCQIGVDPYGLQTLIEQVEMFAPVCAIAQGYKIGPYIEGFEREVFSGNVRQHGSSLLAWCIQNSLIEIRSSAKSIRKRGDQHSPLKIDLAVCCIMAFAASQAEAVAPSVYDSPAMIM